jgi:hypothetical protein
MRIDPNAGAFNRTGTPENRGGPMRARKDGFKPGRRTNTMGMFRNLLTDPSSRADHHDWAKAAPSAAWPTT